MATRAPYPTIVHDAQPGEITSDTLSAYDLVFLGSACHDADLAKPAKQILARIATSPPFKLAGFATHACNTPDGGERDQELYERWASGCNRSFQRASEEKEIDFMGYFGCQGTPSPGIAEFIHNVIITDEDEWSVFVEQMSNRPNQEDVQRAKEFARTVLAQLSG